LQQGRGVSSGAAFVLLDYERSRLRHLMAQILYLLFEQLLHLLQPVAFQDQRIARRNSASLMMETSS